MAEANRFPRRPWPGGRAAAASLFLLLACGGVAPLCSGEDAPQKPGEKPVTPEEVEDLRRDIEGETRSSFELLFNWHGESGDLNNQLLFPQYGLRLNLKHDSSTVELRVARTSYATRDNVIDEAGTGAALGVRTKHSDHLESHFELGATRFSNDTWSVTGLAAFMVKHSEKARYSVTASRTNVEESLLSVVGLRPFVGPFAGRLVGAVRDNRASLGGSYRLPARLDLYGETALGVRTGENAGTNWFGRAAGGVGWNALTVEPSRRLSFLRLSVFGDTYGFREDRLGYGGASLLSKNGRPIPPSVLGSDRISPVPSLGNPGVGGYFSPARFRSVVGRADARGRARPSVDYELSGFLGTQSFTGASRRQARGLSVTFLLRPTRRLILPLTYAWDNFGPFSQQTLLTRLVIVL